MSRAGSVSLSRVSRLLFAGVFLCETCYPPAQNSAAPPKETPRCWALFCCFTLVFIARISGNWVKFGFPGWIVAVDPLSVPCRQSWNNGRGSTGCSLPGLFCWKPLPCWVGGEKKSDLGSFSLVCVFGFGFCMVTLSFPCCSSGLVLLWWIEMLLLSCWCLPLSWFIWIPSDYAVIVCPLSG